MESLKEVFESDLWIITKIYKGGNILRIDARRRFPIADKNNFYSKWGSYKYIDSLSREHYGKPINEWALY